jgi:hypothetical protein
MPENTATFFALCRCASRARNDVALSPAWFRVTGLPRRDKLVQGRRCAIRSILAIVFLCTAFSFGKAQTAYAGQLSDQQIADVANYIRNSWGNAAPLVTPAQVRKARR